MKDIEFTYGPLNKSLFTQEYELLVKMMLENPDSFRFYGADQAIHLQIEETDIDINLTNLLRRVNFSHLEMGREDSDQFLALYPKAELNYFESDASAFQEKLDLGAFENLTEGEFWVIREFTGCKYHLINSFLYNNPSIYDFYLKGDDRIEEAMLKSAFIASGLNKLPNCEEDIFLYRGDKPSTDDLQMRIELVEEGNGLTKMPAFMSSSSEKEVAEDFGYNYLTGMRVLIQFDQPYGKDISSVSYYQSELEYLFTPSTFHWVSYEIAEHEEIQFRCSTRIVDGEEKWECEQYVEIAPMHVFHVEVVEPLIFGEDDFTQDELNEFLRLKNWGESHHVDTTFVTSHLSEILNVTPNQVAHVELLIPKVDLLNITPASPEEPTLV